jgi:hypothetical protein
MNLRILAALALILPAIAQEAALTSLEKQFQDSMSNVTLTGKFSRPDGRLSEEKYTIEKVAKMSGDLWRFEARIQYGGKDVTVPIPIHVQWAGDTAVLQLTDEAVPMMGKFTVRIAIYRGQYAGMWSGAGAGHGGQMFGTIVKNAQ